MTSAGAEIVEIWEYPILIYKIVIAGHWFCQVSDIPAGIISY